MNSKCHMRIYQSAGPFSGPQQCTVYVPQPKRASEDCSAGLIKVYDPKALFLKRHVYAKSTFLATKSILLCMWFLEERRNF